MDSIVDEKTEKIIFLYKLVKGVCMKSFGINVAKVYNICYFYKNHFIDCGCSRINYISC